MWKREEIKRAIEKALEDKGKRKFLQTVELIVNMRGIDFSKQENRLNLSILLPKGRGKEIKVAVFADDPIASKAKEAGADLLISSSDIDKMSESEVKKMCKGWVFLAQPQLMAKVGKKFGQILGSRGKLPRPLVGDVSAMVRNMRNTILIRSKGKYLPTVHCPIGTEEMSVDDLTENAIAVLEALKGKVGDWAFSSGYIKLTMGKPVKIGG